MAREASAEELAEHGSFDRPGGRDRVAGETSAEELAEHGSFLVQLVGAP